MQSENIGAIAKALAAAQAELTNPTKKKTAKVAMKAGGSYSYAYADLADVLDTVRPVFAKHGIAITQPTFREENVLFVQTQLSHSGSGEWMTSEYPVCSLSGDHKAMGAAMTYARRYALSSIAGVAADDDTDGEGASEVEAPKRKSSAQAKRDDDWPKLEHELADCGSAVAVDKLQRSYEENEYKRWSQTWREQADEAFDKRRQDFGMEPGEVLTLREQLEGSVEAEKVAEPTRADYLLYCRETANGFRNRDDANMWWAEQAAARKRYRLSPAEESDIRAQIKASLDKPTTTFVPNARARAEAKAD